VSTAILGAGTLGLTLAHRLALRGEGVTVFEAASQVGGLATWHDYGPFTWDRHYHVILRQDRDLIGLCDELGIGGRLKWKPTQTGFLWRGRHLSMNNSREFLTFPALNPLQKFRLARGIFRVQRLEDPEPLERVSAADWLQDVFGVSVYRAIWEPLLASKYGVLKDRVPATIMWATIRRYYRARDGRTGRETMGFLDGGLKTLFDGLLGAITGNGGVVRTGTPIRGLDVENERVVLELDSGDTESFDHVFATVPTATFKRLLSPKLRDVSLRGQRPEMLGVIRLALVLNRALSPYYVTNLMDTGYPFTGIIEVSALTGSKALNGCHLVMLPRYDVPDSRWFQKSDDEITEFFLDALRFTWPNIDTDIVGRHVQREHVVQALWVEPPATAPQPRVFADGRIVCVNAELAGRDTLNNNAIVRVANDFVDSRFAASCDPGPLPAAQHG